MRAENCLTLFAQVLFDYHQIDQVDTPLPNPYSIDSIDSLLYHKCWVDTVQWHLEDLVRDPSIEPEKGLKLKRRIDASNQLRTDLVEKIDDYILGQLHGVTIQTNATLNTERYPCQPKLPIIRIMIDLAQNFSHTRRLFNVFENNFHDLA